MKQDYSVMIPPGDAGGAAAVVTALGTPMPVCRTMYLRAITVLPSDVAGTIINDVTCIQAPLNWWISSGEAETVLVLGPYERFVPANPAAFLAAVTATIAARTNAYQYYVSDDAVPHPKGGLLTRAGLGAASFDAMLLSPQKATRQTLITMRVLPAENVNYSIKDDATGQLVSGRWWTAAGAPPYDRIVTQLFRLAPNQYILPGVPANFQTALDRAWTASPDGFGPYGLMLIH